MRELFDRAFFAAVRAVRGVDALCPKSTLPGLAAC
jgi:hypothetical protein